MLTYRKSLLSTTLSEDLVFESDTCVFFHKHLGRSRISRSAGCERERRRNAWRPSWRPKCRATSRGVVVEVERPSKTAQGISLVLRAHVRTPHCTPALTVLNEWFCSSADLKQMHKLNEEAYSNPKQSQRPAVMAAHPVEAPQPKERVSGTEAQSTSLSQRAPQLSLVGFSLVCWV